MIQHTDQNLEELAILQINQLSVGSASSLYNIPVTAATNQEEELFTDAAVATTQVEEQSALAPLTGKRDREEDENEDSEEEGEATFTTLAFRPRKRNA